MHQRIEEGDIQKLDRDFIDLPKKLTYSETVKMEDKMQQNNDNEGTKRELLEAKSRIDQLEKKIAILEGRVPQKYPEVKFLGYKLRKRILVRYFIFTHSIFFDKLSLITTDLKTLKEIIQRKTL